MKRAAPKPPPACVWVSFCTMCGVAICASVEPHDTSCPHCPYVDRPVVKLARYQLVPGTIRKQGRS